MNDTDKKEFAEVMLSNGEIYNKEISKSFMQAYFNALTDYSIAEVKDGISKHALDPKHGSFFPKPADIVRHLKENQITTEQKAELAWAQVMRVMRTEGSYGSLSIDDKQALAAIKSFTNWKDLCMLPENKLTWAKKEFMSMYSTYENTPLEMLPSSLPGREELVEHKKEGAKSLGYILNGITKHREET